MRSADTLSIGEVLQKASAIMFQQTIFLDPSIRLIGKPLVQFGKPLVQFGRFTGHDCQQIDGQIDRPIGIVDAVSIANLAL